MWEVVESVSESKWFLIRYDLRQEMRGYIWPIPTAADPGWIYSSGTAQTMCDIFNARDYPEEFAGVTPVTNVVPEVPHKGDR